MKPKAKKYEDERNDNEGKERGFVLRFVSSECPPFPERRMIYPNGILPAPPILLLLHHLRHLGDLRSPPIRRRLCVGHHDNEGQPNTTDKPCCFLCTPGTLYGKLLFVLLGLLLRRLRTW